MSNPSFFVLREVEARLAAAHPAAFTTPAPLALDVFDRLKAAHPEFGSSKLSAFLGRWMSSRAYLKALIEGSWRIDLDGTAVEGISDDARVEALARLQERPVGDPRDRLESDRARALYETSDLFRRLISILEEAQIEVPLSGEAAALVRAVMAFHPNTIKFDGVLPVPMVVLVAGKRCFGWEREDGSVDTFSILKCALRAEEDQRGKGLGGVR